MRFALRFQRLASRGAVRLVMIGLALLAVMKPALTQQPPAPAMVSGTVFQDRDENGIRDAHEPGVGGVSVSDGKVTVETDGQGRYSLPVDTERRLTDIVFIGTPDGYVVPADGDKTPRFYRILAGLLPGGHRTQDFALLRRSGSSPRHRPAASSLAATRSPGPPGPAPAACPRTSPSRRA